MKNFYLLLFCTVLFCYSCEKTEYVQSEPQLEFTVVQGSAVVVEGATITIYNTQQDWQLGENSVSSLQTDAQGKAIFTDLLEQKYYFHVEKGELNNLADIGATHNPLKKGQKSQLLVKISPTVL